MESTLKSKQSFKTTTSKDRLISQKKDEINFKSQKKNQNDLLKQRLQKRTDPIRTSKKKSFNNDYIKQLTHCFCRHMEY